MRKRGLILGALLLILIISIVLPKLKKTRTPEGIIVGSGRVEGDEIELSPKIPGKVIKLFVDEGDRVKKGEVVALLKSKEYEARVSQAKANLEAFKKRCSAAMYDWLLTKKSVEIEIERAKKELDVAKHRMLVAKANYEKAASDFKRFRNLYREKAISKSKFEEIKRIYETSREAYQASMKGVDIARKNLLLAMDKMKLVKSKESIYKAMKDEVKRAEAVLKEAEAYLEDTEIRSPIDGVVLEKLVEPGEVVSSGTPIFVVVNLEKLYLKMFIDEKNIGRVALGMPARIYVDAYPKRPFDAYVCFVAQRAEFTPKEVETFTERVHHVFAVKLCVKNNKLGLLKPGMPADGVVKYSGKRWYNPLTREVE